MSQDQGPGMQPVKDTKASRDGGGQVGASQRKGVGGMAKEIGVPTGTKQQGSPEASSSGSLKPGAICMFIMN